MLKKWDAGKKNKGGPRQRPRERSKRGVANGGGITYFFAVAGTRRRSICFKVFNFFFKGCFLFKTGEGGKFCHWVSDPQNPNNLFIFLALQETNRTEARRISSEHSVIW